MSSRPGDALEAIARADEPQETARCVERRHGVATVERQAPLDEHLEPVRGRGGGELVGLRRASLPPPQFGQARERVDLAAGPDRRQLAGGRSELRVCAVPVSLPHEHVRVVRAADREHLAIAVARRHLLDALAPLPRAFEIAHATAGVNDETADGLDGIDVAHLPAERGRGGRIEAPHPGIDLTETDVREAIDRQREHLDVDRADLTRERQGLPGKHARGLRVVVGEQRQMRLHHRDERGGETRGPPLDQHRGALHPALRLGRPAERVGVVAELDREPRRRRDISLRPRKPIATLVSLERSIAIELVTRRDAEPLIGLRHLLICQHLSEALPRERPCATRKRRPPLLDHRAVRVRWHRLALCRGRGAREQDRRKAQRVSDPRLPFVAEAELS